MKDIEKIINQGIRVRKYHYSKKENKECTLFLSPDY